MNPQEKNRRDVLIVQISGLKGDIARMKRHHYDENSEEFVGKEKELKKCLDDLNELEKKKVDVESSTATKRRNDLEAELERVTTLYNENHTRFKETRSLERKYAIQIKEIKEKLNK